MSRILADMKAFGTQYLRSRVGTFFALIFPILLILLFGAIFGSSGSTRVTLYVQDLDNKPASHAFIDALGKTNVTTTQAIPASENFSQYIREHSINVALQIPLGFQDALSKAGNGTRATVNLTLAGDQTQSSYGIAVSAVDAVATAFNLQVVKASPVINVLPTSIPGLRHLTYIDLFLPGIIGFTIL
ncbi:MAG TPA: ABC transporter permease, partial [Thermoplasmata archaeon]|nr:ABC transporter permease [Thermoplasmata archaeon]